MGEKILKICVKPTQSKNINRLKDIFIVITTMYKKCLGNVGGKLGYTIAKTKALIGKVLILKDKRSFIVNDFSNKIKSKILHICFLLFCFCFFCFYENKSLMMLTNNSCHFCSLYWPKTFKSISDLREIKKRPYVSTVLDLFYVDLTHGIFSIL